MNDFFVNANLLQLIVKWKKQLVIIGIAAAILSGLFSSPLFIKPRYKSFAIVYPANIVPYGVETPTEQLLQLLESNDIRDSIVKKFHLASHYELDSTDTHFLTDLIKNYEDNVSLRKTEFESVKIEVMDIHPDTAYMMVKEILHLLDIKARTLQREKTSELAEAIKRQYDKKKTEMDSIDLAIKTLRVKFGLLDYNTQTREVVKRYLRVVSAGGSQSNINELESLMRNLEEKGGDFIALNEHLWRVRNTYNDLKLSYENALKDLNKELSYSNIITQPFPADKKSYPVRWIIVLASVVAALFFAIITMMIIDRKEQLQNSIRVLDDMEEEKAVSKKFL